MSTRKVNHGAAAGAAAGAIARVDDVLDGGCLGKIAQGRRLLCFTDSQRVRA